MYKDLFIRFLKSNFIKIFTVLNLLFLGLILINLIPNSFIYKNLCKSAEYYNTYSDSIFKSGSEPGGDLNQLNIMMNVDTKRPIYSTLIDPIYGETGGFRDASNGYTTITKKAKANNDYSRYWHGYQIIYRPLLMVFNTQQIMTLLWGIYVILLAVVTNTLWGKYDKYSILAFLIMHVVFILPVGFKSITYIPVYFIMLLGVYLVSNTKLSPVYIFSLLGLLVSFFDFLTVETLTITVPMIFYIYIKNKEESLKIKNCIKCGVSWLFWYSFAYIYKWTIATVAYNQNYFKKAIEEITKYKSMFGRQMSFKININNLFFGVVSYNTSYYFIIISAIVLLIALYLFRKEGTEKCLICIIAVCLVPYLRYLVLAGHSYEHAYFEYRAQIVLLPAIVMLIYIALGRQRGVDKNK